jgi:hypothetical protein
MSAAIIELSDAAGVVDDDRTKPLVRISPVSFS